MTHRTVAPASETYEIRLTLHARGEVYRLATLREATPRQTKRLYQTIERRQVDTPGEYLAAELYNLEQDYAHWAHITDADTVERLTGENYLTLVERAHRAGAR